MNGYLMLGGSNGFRIGSPGYRFHSPGLGGAVLGQETNRQWYEKAKSEVAEYEGLVRRTQQVANKTERENILAWLGSPTVPTTPAYRYNSVKSDIIQDVEAFMPLNYGAYALERRRNRVRELESINSDFRARVSDAERVYGRLPAPVVIREPGEAADITVPIIAAGAAIALAVLLAS